MKRMILLFSLLLIAAGCSSQKNAQQTATAVFVAGQTATADYSLNGPCGTQKVSEYVKSTQSINSKWMDAYQVASVTGRIALSGPVSNLQSIKQEAEKITPPDCLANAHTNFLYSMDATISAFLSFMSKDPDSVVQGHFDNAARALKIYNDEIDRIKSCAPNCK